MPNQFTIKLPDKSGKTGVIKEGSALFADLKKLCSAAERGENTVVETLAALTQLAAAQKVNVGNIIIMNGEWSHGETIHTCPAGYNIGEWANVESAEKTDEEMLHIEALYTAAVNAINDYNDYVYSSYNPLACVLGTVPLDPFRRAYYPSRQGRKAGDKPTKSTADDVEWSDESDES